MATQKREIKENHPLNANKEVRLTITIGNDQIGGSKVWFKGTSTLLGSGKIIGLPLGSGGDLLGRTLCIQTNFYDKNPLSNNISATYNFNNGEPPLHTYYDMVKNENDFFVFNLAFTFK